MRWQWFLMLAGCGRLEFETTADARDPDALTPPPGCTGADEDSDGWPDACDNCPTVANPRQADAGELAVGALADGIGDACDPRPGLPGDRVAFVALHEGEALASYDAMYGTASVPGNGALRLGTLDDFGSVVFSFTGEVTRIDCTYTVVASSTTLQWFGVWTDDTATDALFLESAWDVGGGVFRMKEDWEIAPDRYSPDIAGPARFVPGARYRIVADTERVTGTEQRLTVTDLGSGQSASTSLAIQIPRFAKGYIEANKAIIDFEYLVIYGE